MGAPIGGVDWDSNQVPESIDSIYQRMVRQEEKLDVAFQEILQEFKALDNYKIGNFRIILDKHLLKLMDDQESSCYLLYRINRGSNSIILEDIYCGHKIELGHHEVHKTISRIRHAIAELKFKLEYKSKQKVQ